MDLWYRFAPIPGSIGKLVPISTAFANTQHILFRELGSALPGGMQEGTFCRTSALIPFLERPIMQSTYISRAVSGSGKYTEKLIRFQGCLDCRILAVHFSGVRQCKQWEMPMEEINFHRSGRVYASI